MELIYNKIFLEHDTGSHPENRKRLECLGSIKETPLENGEQFIPLVHSKKYIEQVKEACKLSGQLDADTLTSPKSFDAANYAVSAAIHAAHTNNFALVRPPGHHAYPDRGSGFCLFNNMAVAVQTLLNEGKRAAILDFDGHYGDGTAFCFYNTDKVLYCSLHQFPAFPGNGFCDEIGEGKGTGFNINVPLPPGSGDDLFIQSIEKILLPVIEQFHPDVVGISAGFDAHRNDPLLQLNVSANSFYKAGFLLKSKFKNVFACLEGGYNTNAIPLCIHSFLDGINGKPGQLKEQETTSNTAVVMEYNKRIKLLNRYIGEYWKIYF